MSKNDRSVKLELELTEFRDGQEVHYDGVISVVMSGQWSSELLVEVLNPNDKNLKIVVRKEGSEVLRFHLQHATSHEVEYTNEQVALCEIVIPLIRSGILLFGSTESTSSCWAGVNNFLGALGSKGPDHTVCVTRKAYWPYRSRVQYGHFCAAVVSTAA